MIEFLTQLIQDYGLLGLFLSSFLGSTIFIPFSVELVFPPLLASGLDPYKLVLISVVASTLGVWVNYLLGEYGSHKIEKYISKKDLDKATRIMDKYGWAGVFLIMMLPLPLPSDPVTVLCGLSKMNKKEFTIVVVAGKFIKYGVSVGLLNAII